MKDQNSEQYSSSLVVGGCGGLCGKEGMDFWRPGDLLLVGVASE